MLPSAHWEPACGARFDSSAAASQHGARKHFGPVVTQGLLGGYVEPPPRRAAAVRRLARCRRQAFDSSRATQAPPPPFAVDTDVPPPLPRRGLQPPPRATSVWGGVDCRETPAPPPPPQPLHTALDLLIRPPSPGQAVPEDEADRPLRGRGMPPHSLLSRPSAERREGEAWPQLEGETEQRSCRRSAPAPRSSIASLLEQVPATAPPPPAPRPTTAAGAEALANRLRNSLTHSELTVPPLYPSNS